MLKYIPSFLFPRLLLSGFTLSAMVLMGCSTSHDHSTFGTLLTHIRDDGSKLFVFTSKPPRRLPKQIQNDNSPPSRVMRRQRSSGRTGKDALEQVYKTLEKRLEEARYCREGYLPLGSYLEFGQFEIRGECQETATKEDRLLFRGGTVY